MFPHLQSLLLNLKIENQIETAKSLNLLRELSSQIQTQKTVFQNRGIKNLEKNLQEKNTVKKLENQIENLSLSQRLVEVTSLLKGVLQDQNQVITQNDRLQVNWDRVWDENESPLLTEALQAQTGNIHSLVQQQRLESAQQKNEIHSDLETKKGELREQVQLVRKPSFWQGLLKFIMPLIGIFLNSTLPGLFQLGAASLQQFLAKILNALSTKLLEFLQRLMQTPAEETEEKPPSIENGK